MFGTGDGSAPEIVCPWAGLVQLNLARKAALAAMKTAEELAGVAVEAEELAEAAVKTAEKTAEEVSVGFLIQEKLRNQDNLASWGGFLVREKLRKQYNVAPLPPQEHRTEFEQFVAERQKHPELKNEKEIPIHPVDTHEQLSYVGDIETFPPPPPTRHAYDNMEVTASTNPEVSSYHYNHLLTSMLDPAQWTEIRKAHNIIQSNVPDGHLGEIEMVQINNYLNDPGSKLSALSDASSQMVHVAHGGSSSQIAHVAHGGSDGSSRLPKRHATAWHGMVACKLERDQVREIFRMAILPMSMPLGKERKDALADVCQILLDKFKVSITTIKDIINRKTWRSVTIDLWTRDQRETFAAEHSTKRRGRPYKDTTIESLPKKDKDVKRNVGRPRKNPDTILKLYEASCVGLKQALEVGGRVTNAPCPGPPAY